MVRCCEFAFKKDKLSTHHFIRRVTFILSEISDALLDSCEYSNYLQLQVPYFLD